MVVPSGLLRKEGKEEEEEEEERWDGAREGERMRVGEQESEREEQGRSETEERSGGGRRKTRVMQNKRKEVSDALRTP